MSYNLSEFDFDLPSVSRSHTPSIVPFDLVCTVSVKGRRRKVTTFQCNFTGLERKFNRRPKSVSFGLSKFKKKSAGLLLLDNTNLEHILIPLKEAGNMYPIANNKGMTQKLFNYAGVSLPEVPDTVVSVYFICKAVQGQPNIYEVFPDHVLMIDANGGKNRKKLNESNNGQQIQQATQRF